MYSYEDRIRAVRLYLELDRRLGITLRTLGYPTKNSLFAWVREYDSRLDLKPGYRRARRQYDENQKRIADLSETHISAGKLYISPIIDCFDGLVVSWTIGTRPDARLVNAMLDSAIDTLRPHERPIIHTDRGAHYRWPQWLRRLRQAQLTPSMSRKGCSPDNAACEGFFGRLKTELFYPRDWQQVSLEECMHQIDLYIRWYNETRIKL